MVILETVPKTKYNKLVRLIEHLRSMATEKIKLPFIQNISCEQNNSHERSEK